MMMTVTVWYCPQIILRRVTPPPATWIISTIAMNLSAASYYATGKPWVDNVVVYAAAVEIIIVTTVLLTTLYRYNELVISFDWVQKACLISMVGITAYWFINRDAMLTFKTTQTLMVLAYVPVVIKGLKLKTAFDSIGSYSWICGSAVVGGAIPFITNNELAQFASVRAVVTSGLTVLMFIYFDRQQNWQRWKGEIRTLKEVYGIK